MVNSFDSIDFQGISKWDEDWMPLNKVNAEEVQTKLNLDITQFPAISKMTTVKEYMMGVYTATLSVKTENLGGESEEYLYMHCVDTCVIRDCIAFIFKRDKSFLELSQEEHEYFCKKEE